jgi:transcriptional regulator NrdR family protein
MRCPECNSTIKPTDYDPVFEWYECPKCEGCFTYAEIIESSGTGNRVVAAKGKKRQADREADANLENEMTQAVVKKKVPSAEVNTSRHRDELPTGQVVNIMSDEIQEIYGVFGSAIDTINAREKALIIWRDLMVYGHVAAREQAVPYVQCKDHSI